jgi:hypothetical protein
MVNLTTPLDSSAVCPIASAPDRNIAIAPIYKKQLFFPSN